MESKGAIGPFVPKLPQKEERSDTLFLPNEEILEEEAKATHQQVDFHRPKFREGMAHGLADQPLGPSFQEDTQSSYGMFALNRAANAPTHYPAKNSQYSQKSSAFQVFSNLQSDESKGNLLHILLNEVRMQSKLNMEILEKVDLQNKMLSVLIKDYQLSKYASLTRIEKKQVEELLETSKTNDSFFNMIGKGPDETLTKKDLYMFLKNPEVEYKYQLELLNEVELPLVKERNFQ